MRREDIERLDFPAARRGYERAAVDAHLAKLAAEFERLEAAAAKPASSLADTAGTSVAGIIAAAEEKAGEIEADAKRDAETSGTDAQAKAKAIIAEAEEAVKGLVAEARELQARVSGLGEGLGTLSPQAETEPAIVPEPTPPEREIDPTPVIVPEPSPEPVPEPTPDPVPEPVPSPDPVPEPTPMPQPETPQPQAHAAKMTNGNGSSDNAGARLVAMKMALDGASREDVQKHLASSYDVSSSDELLDDVFARVAK